MLTSRIFFKNFKLTKKKSPLVKKKLLALVKEKNEIIKSLTKDYKNNFNHKTLKKFKNSLEYRVIGVGGSSLGAQAIYDFLNFKIKKKFVFFDNLKKNYSKKNKNYTNLVISKSGNTIETIVNANLLIKKKDKNIFITEDKKNYLHILAERLKADIVHHNNYIGGRYSVLSEVGMLPAELMGLDPKKFRRLDNLIKNPKFINLLISNVQSILYFIKQKKFNSVILNYDQNSKWLFDWYQQLLAESLGKKGKGILPIVSEMPKDNHSVMQLYLDGFKNNFFTFFYCKEKKSDKLKKKQLLNSHKFLGTKNVNEIIFKQKIATENVFRKKKIPFRSFELNIRNEETLGELFCYFMLETIMLGKALNVNPFNQPSVELIKKETKRLFN